MIKRNRKNVLPLGLVTLVAWGLLTGLVTQVDPVIVKNWPLTDAYGILVLAVFAAMFGLATIIFGHTRRGLFVAAVAAGLVWLRLVRLANIINVGLLVAILLAVDIYFESR